MIYDFAKRIVDLIGSITALVLLAPILLLVAIAVKLDSPGPVLADTPMRSGKSGKLFKIYKFRSMVQNAHEILEKNPKLLEEYKKNSYKIFNDPRITNIGKFLRRFSLDELPQFLNILKGDMSLVGPRAYYPYELEEQQKKFPSSRRYVKIILSGKPGVTGLWQVSGRSEISFERRVKMDAKYVKRRSLFYDFWIMLKTIPAVVSGKGAI